MEQDEAKQFAECLITESGMDPTVLSNFKKGCIMCSSEPKGDLSAASEKQLQTIREIEADGYSLVWHIIDGIYVFPQGKRRVLTYLIVRKNSTVLRKAGKCVLSHDYSLFCDTGKGSYGDAIIEKRGSGLHRVA